MANDTLEQRISPLVIVALVALLVAVIALWAMDKAARGEREAGPGAAQTGEVFHWKLVTTWPKNFPGLGSAPEIFAQEVEAMSGGRLTVRVYGGGEIVPALGVFDAVSQGVAQMGHGAAYYWKGKVPSSVFFTAVPFGLNAQEMYGWLYYGGGLQLWEEAYTPYNLVPLPGGSTGVQMGGWFNREINTVADVQGLKMRIPGLAGEVFTAAGGTSVTLPGSELYTSLQTGVIDALEWVGPYNDRIMGFQDVAKYYYYPGWHEPGSILEFIVNKEAMASLPEDLQAIVRAAAKAASEDMLAEYTARNNESLRELLQDHDVQLRRFPEDVLRAFWLATGDAMRDLTARDPMAAKVYASYRKFYRDVREYHHISEQAYINMRDDIMGDAEF
ncbi:ABC transporter substrate-binding protein [Mangrovimicrobium sediminis]|uniref:ABC transporter substrate-binding protein n=1 Tax=Mangrovimicrobium sediminis TaxID=2562682 RepID=A0A4Z0M004_9GAMM|nr:TRAP transporter substrate-binding protein DctP [Haliea sp. SAOS-164]TGD72766.1 ABC transporter substrate-binding protein [Haliea sp. SAOS-164]